MKEPPLLNLNAPPAIAPERYLYPAPAVLFVHVMACSKDRSLAVLCYDNALRLLALEGSEATLSYVAHDYLPSIVGGLLSNVEPNPSEHELAYLQSRRLVLFDMASRVHTAHRVIDDVHMEELAVGGAFASLKPQVVIVQVEDTSHYDEEGHVEARLVSCELGETGAVRRGTLELEQDAEKELDWGAGRGLVTAFKHGVLEVYTPMLEALPQHPLGKALRELFEQRKALRFQGFRFHPARDTVVFGLLEKDREGMRNYSLFQADFPGGAISIQPIARVEDVGLFQLGSYASNGQWFFFRISEEGQAHFFVKELFADNPPLYLGAFSSPKAAQFVRGPLAFVVLDDDLEVACSFPLPPPMPSSPHPQGT